MLAIITVIAGRRMMGAVSASNRTLAMMSNRRLAKPESRRPEENPSEKMNQLGLTLSRSTRTVSRSRKLERSLTCTPVVLIRRRPDNESALGRPTKIGRGAGGGTGGKKEE